MINAPHEIIILKPKFGFWVSRYFIVIVIASLIPISTIYWDFEMQIHYSLMGLFVVIWLMLCYTYIDMLFTTRWVITKDELIFRHGIFSRHEDHLELYRVIDYSEKQGFWQILFRNKTVKIISGDSTDPILYMYGVDKKIPIIDILRDRVRIARKEYGIYEVTNR